MLTKHTHETGQILIIFAVALTALLGFAALAIDGGMIFADRRQSQSVADSASLAGAGAAASVLETGKISWTKFTCDTADPNYVTVYNAINAAYAAAYDRASKNHVTDLDNDISDGHGVDVKPFCDAPHFQKYLDVTTKVTSTVSTSFAHLFYPGQIKNTVTAVTRLHPREEFGYGNAIVALNKACPKGTEGMIFDGTSTVNVTGGGIFSNGCLKASGNVTVDASFGGVHSIIPADINGGASVSPLPSPAAEPIRIQYPPPHQCGPDLGAINGGGLFGPGTYSDIALKNGNTGILQLKPGLYCITGTGPSKGISITGGEIDSIIDPDGYVGVTFYLMGSSQITINGGAKAHLNAATIEVPKGGAMKGILIYMAKGNTSNINLIGTSDSSFGGTIFAPDGSIDVGGNTVGVTNPAYNLQLIGWDVRVHGKGLISVDYDASSTYTTNPNADLTQ